MICKRLLTFDHGIIRVLDLVNGPNYLLKYN
jgi:hypothetical protein